MQALGLGDDVQIKEELGRGAQTAVYRLHRDGHDYALKVLHATGPDVDAALRAFSREAALLSRIAHPGVPRVFDVGAADGQPYLVMEFIDGQPLTRRLAAGRLTEDELVGIAKDVAGALAAAHGCGLVHRDIKPANIILTGSGHARLIDFGLATFGRPDPSVESIVGTFDYSAPEQTGMLARPVDGRADLYALGVVMFQGAAGELPFQAADVAQLLRVHATVPAPDLRELRPDLNSALAQLVARLLAKEPDDRIPTARDLRVALSRIRPDAGGAAQSRPDDANATGYLLGREREQAALRDRWQRARAGASGVALLQGPAGVGKSRLAAQLSRAVQADAALVLCGRCDPDSVLPLAPLRQAVDGYLRSVAEMWAGARADAVAALRAAAGIGLGLLCPLSPLLEVLLEVPELGADERYDQFAGAVATFLSGLAQQHGGLLLVLEDVQWLDPASQAVLRRVVEESEAPVLVLATARDDPDAADAFIAAAGERLDLRVPVGQLNEPDSAALVTAYLGGSAVGQDVLAELWSRGGGNPFTILEYLNALVDAGALRPHWGTWRLDADRLQAINLPSDVFTLVLARVAGLGERARQILTAAAAVGPRFDAALVAALTDDDTVPVLAEAVQRGVLQAARDGYAFVHDRIRESLLSAVDPAELRRLHQRIAVALDERGDTEPAHVYAVAHHYANGETGRTPQRLVATGWSAGQLALDENAPSAAVPYLETAAATAEANGFAVDSRLHQALALAYLATGHAEAAQDQIEGALHDEVDPLRRAALQLQLANAARIRWELGRSLAHVRAGLVELGRPLPSHPAVLGILLPVWLLRWLVVGMRRPRRRPPTGEAAERLRLTIWLHQAGATAAGMSPPSPLLAAYNLRPTGWVHRLGTGSEYVLSHAACGIVAAILHRRRRRDRIFRRCAAIARELSDPKLTAMVAWLESWARLMGGDGSPDEVVQVSETHRRWLEVDFHSNMLLMRSRHLAARGYARESLDWHDRGRSRLSDSTAQASTGFALAEAAARSLLGRAATLPPPRHSIARRGPDAGYWMQYLPTAVQIAVEQDELGEPFEEAVTAVHQVRVRPAAVFGEQRMVFVYEALGRLTRAQRAEHGSRPDLLATATTALRRLGKAAKDPLTRTYHQIAQASLEQLSGQPDRALTRLARAERLLTRVDAPLAHFEAARVRARALHDLGDEALAAQQADIALLLANRHGWARRARWIRAEFATASVMNTSFSGSTTRQHHTEADRYRRRLEALQQVGAAAARVLDPRELARIALDEILRILGAERAVLFHTDDDGTLQLTLGRTGTGDLTELTGYSASLVERVAAERRPLVVTSGDEGAALGSQSTVIHGLRSIMIAPLEMEGRLLGVMYLDSRVAKGVFTEDDVTILTAVTNQLTVSMETARAAQLETAVAAARQQRDTAETLREAVNRLTATLDPDQVMQQLCDIVTHTLPAERVCLLHQDGARFVVVGNPVAQPARADQAEVLTVATLRSGTSHNIPGAVSIMLGATANWLAIPLRTRSEGRGVLIAGSTGGEQFNPAQLDIAVALAGQGATAYDNARLFAQVQELATTDPLTGLFNRRHFTDLAPIQLAVAIRNRRPAVGIMVDIDHFKKVNDTYGHGTGDEVIRAVATVLRAQVREPDVVCRYGGEEFALVMSEMNGNPTDVAERLRVAVAALAIPGPAGSLHVTVSIGIAELKPDDDLTSLLERADEALYQAKQRGRNQVKAT